MKEKTVVVEIDEQGNSSMDLEGFQGSGCSAVAKDFQGSDAVKNVRNKARVLHPSRDYDAAAKAVKEIRLGLSHECP